MQAEFSQFTSTFKNNIPPSSESVFSNLHPNNTNNTNTNTNTNTSTTTIDNDWPKPPFFDTSKQFLSDRFEPTRTTKVLRGTKIKAMDAPIALANSKDIDLAAMNLQKRNTERFSPDNPYQLDTTTNPFTPLKPTFFNGSNNNNNIVGDMPRPCIVPVIEKKWEQMTSEEKKDYYMDKKSEYMEYLDETFEQRLELHCEGLCDEPWNAYQRCLEIKNLKFGGQKWSTSRAALTQMYVCASQYHNYYHCLDTVDWQKATEEVKEQDRKQVQQMFPK